MPQTPASCDLLVIGGGINGTGIARDAAGRGLTVVLAEQHDLASHTSSASTKLIHGGLRYLEHYEFGLVRKALREREVLLRSAPHIMWPLRFVMPHQPDQRPAWLIRSGLFLYDHLARRRLLPGSESLDLERHAAGHGLRAGLTRGFAYSDGWVDDARLVALAALDAAERGATILVRHRCTAVQAHREGWQVTLQPQHGGPAAVWQTRAIVNAAGPWATQVPGLPVPAGRTLRLVRGSHIVVPRLFGHDYAYLLQQPDQRVVFAIPYERHFTLIGTTDVEHVADPAEARASVDEIRYLCEAVNHYLSHPITPDDVVWHYAGVRPLVDDHQSDASAVTRDYQLEWQENTPPLLHVFGGKLTTFRQLAEEATSALAHRLSIEAPPWTRRASLPGGEHLLSAGPHVRNVLQFDRWVSEQQRRYPWLPAELCQRYARAYGSRLHRLLASCRSLSDLGPTIVPGLHEREAHYLRSVEWAQTAEDILWRRTKLGLHLPAHAASTLEQWLARQAPVASSAATEFGEAP